MLLDYYKLAEEPFGVTPDPRFLYLSQQHREAMDSLAYGTEAGRGFLALIATPGMGKTSLLYQYLESQRGKARTAFLFRTDCDSREFMRHLLLDLGIDACDRDLPWMHEALNRVLLEEMNAKRHFVLVIDEAQNLDEPVLEQITTCLYTTTPGEDFRIGRLESKGFFASACSGHGFKLGPWVGRLLANMVEGKDAPENHPRFLP